MDDTVDMTVTMLTKIFSKNFVSISRQSTFGKMQKPEQVHLGSTAAIS